MVRDFCPQYIGCLAPYLPLFKPYTKDEGLYLFRFVYTVGMRAAHKMELLPVGVLIVKDFRGLYRSMVCKYTDRSCSASMKEGVNK